MSVDQGSVPSVQARLAELRLQQTAEGSPLNSLSRSASTSAAAPQSRPPRPTPPPPPPRNPPPRYTPALPPRTNTAPPKQHGVVPPLPVSAKPPPPKPPLPSRRSSNASARSVSSGRSLPPAFTSIADLPPLPPKKPPVLPPRKAAPVLPTRKTEPVVSQPREEPAPTVPEIPAVPTRRLPPPPPAGYKPPPPARPTPSVPSSPPPTTRATSSPPPIPVSSRPPPVPRCTRPALAPTHSAPAATTCLYHRDFSLADAHAASPHLHRTRVPSLAHLAHDLTAPFPSATDKARALFTWFHHNIAYDIVGLDTNRCGEQDAEAVLRSGLAVCQGYAQLYKRLADLAGVECAVVGGHGKGAGYDPAKTVAWPPTGHAWNAVRIDGGEWWLLDACWGAGHVGGTTMPRVYTPKFNPSMFESPPREFGRRHYAQEERWNLGGWDWEAYAAPEVRGVTVYQQFKADGFNERVDVLARRLLRGRNRVVLTWGACEHIAPPERVPLMLAVAGEKIEKCNTTPLERTGPRTWEATVDVAEDVPCVTVYKVTKFDNKDALDLTGDEYMRRIGTVGCAWAALLKWDGIDG